MYVNAGIGWKREILESMDLMSIMRKKLVSIGVEVVIIGKARHMCVLVEVVGVVAGIAWSCRQSQNYMRPREETCGHAGTRSTKMCTDKHGNNAIRTIKKASMKSEKMKQQMVIV